MTSKDFIEKKIEEFEEVLTGTNEDVWTATEKKKWLEKALREMAQATVEAVRVEGKNNLITEKRRLTYGDVDEAHNAAITEQEKRAEEWLGV